MEIFVIAMVFVIGICCGSFVNMLVYRTEINYKLRKNLKFKNLKNKDRSFCDHCGKQLHWFENVPIVSWLALGGRSRCCKKKLSWYYPLVELGTGLLFVVFRNDYLGLIIVTLLVFATVFDLKHMILPDFSTYILIVIAAIFYHNWISGLVSFLFLLALHIGTKGKGMGFGDVKLAIFMGLYLGWPKIVIAYYFAFIVGAIIGLILIFSKKLKRDSQIPFGPYLIGGTMVAQILGDYLMYYVNRWF